MLTSPAIRGFGHVLIFAVVNCQAATGTTEIGLRLRKRTDPNTAFGPLIGQTTFSTVVAADNITWSLLREDTITDSSRDTFYRVSVVMQGASANDGTLDHITLVILGLDF